MKKILVGITGSIAAYKTPELLRNLIAAGFELKIVLTRSAQNFITPLTLQAITNSSVHTELLDYTAEAAMSHIELAKWADTILIAPASANFIAKLSWGLCDDLLNTICLASPAPTIIVPAMNKYMWEHAATQDNVTKLKARNVTFLGPEYGVQACGDIGYGRMMDSLEIIQNIVQRSTIQVLKGLNILITAGATWESIDPVRFITNRSSGKMGYALAQQAIIMGANVTLISARATINPPTNCKIIKVTTCDEMLKAVEAEIILNNIFISSAAVSDYKMAAPFSHKIKRNKNNKLTLTLEPNIDILAKMCQEHTTFNVGFAAETENLLQNAQDKLHRKKAHLIIANDISNDQIGFDSNYNEVYIVSKEHTIKLEQNTKEQIAQQLLYHIQQFFQNTLINPVKKIAVTDQ